jgi:quercetin dioxygenase-like cupin family protein
MRYADQLPSLASFCLFVAFAAQSLTIIPLSGEPHHHLALHNEYVNVYQVEVAPHNTVKLHRHDADAISIMLADAEVTVRSPGKPDVRQKLSHGQIRLQARGYVHSTTVESEKSYRNITVELLDPQQNPRNLCASVVATLPQNCPSDPTPGPASAYKVLPQFETVQTRVTLYRVPPQQTIYLSHRDGLKLIIVLDDAFRTTDQTPRTLQAGDFVWLAKDNSQSGFINTTANEIALISFLFQPQ